MNQTKLTQLIKAKSIEEGFQFCGVSKAAFLEEEAPRLEQWLKAGKHGEMGYMANHFDKRLDPRKLVDGAKSVITLLYNYSPEEDINTGKSTKISKYALKMYGFFCQSIYFNIVLSYLVYILKI